MSADDRARVFLDVDAGRSPAAPRPEPDRPFRILILGDFSGAAERTELRGRRPVAVDRDNFDDVLSSFRPSVAFDLAGPDGPDIVAEFDAIDDFHPDNLLRRVPLLRSLVELRQRVRDGELSRPPARGGSETRRSAPPPPSGSLLDQMLDDVAGPAPVAPRSPTPPPSELHAYIQSVLAPHLVAADDPRQTELEAQVEDTMAAALRVVLHHPRFQAIEALWRAVYLLARRLETGPQLKVFLLDLNRDELAADLAGAVALEQSFLHRVLVDDAVSASRSAPWAVIAGDYTFGVDDVELVARLGQLAGRAGAPFLGAAAPALVGLESFASEPEVSDLEPTTDPSWAALRASPRAHYIGLAQPRFLLRMPYDPREEPVETLRFEELATPPAHEEYLWGNPALACALLLGAAFENAGWELRPGAVAELDGLPLHLYRDGGSTEAKPCAETLLRDRVAARMLEAGVMPLLSLKAGDAVRVFRFQSIAHPAAPLAGPWR